MLCVNPAENNCIIGIGVVSYNLKSWTWPLLLRMFQLCGLDLRLPTILKCLGFTKLACANFYYVKRKLEQQHRYTQLQRLQAAMSMERTRLLFEGFLKKQKDTMKMRWSTYWFRLQNTTLFFYNKKGGSALHLRGLYYIYTVQSVRELPREDSRGFVFEITMTNGKRKVLAAETAALRKEWIKRLWQAMHLANPEGNTRNTGSSDSLDVGQPCERVYSGVPVGSACEDDAAVRPFSLPACPTQDPHQNNSSIPVSEEPDSEDLALEDTMPVCHHELHVSSPIGEPIYQNIFSVHDRHANEHEQEEVEDVDYDILPPPKVMCAMDGSSEEDEGLYDVPVSYRWLHEDQEDQENIYNVPSSLWRTTSDEGALEEGGTLLGEMMSSLGGDWGSRETAPQGPCTPVLYATVPQKKDRGLDSLC